ncbi:hypothetical protein [Paenibacillus aceris]|uniref:Uncharacterized protein YajQ (UPF0234 family) n=1 Tax=Paenibacillus aceris TaxID=869555 RepID=A0ABS4I4A9_9BACL|nr:hypothetical protein [Paenibacillus aceris]MBP1965655.1 uncharacterized protein YajQ (UPF0234 family) [Paenibacillus aceris]NHW36369.1 hypothetical protein [Paenibacillus aceris]
MDNGKVNMADGKEYLIQVNIKAVIGKEDAKTINKIERSRTNLSYGSFLL